MHGPINIKYQYSFKIIHIGALTNNLIVNTNKCTSMKNIVIIV